MFKDHAKAHKLTSAISAREKENTITELIHWVKANIDNDNVGSFTQNKFTDVTELISKLCEAYQELGVEGIKGNTSDYLLFIAGNGKDKIYVSHLAEITEDRKKVFAEKLGMDIKDLGPNLSKLNWRKNVSV